jgi:hypothetical protein
MNTKWRRVNGAEEKKPKKLPVLLRPHKIRTNHGMRCCCPGGAKDWIRAMAQAYGAITVSSAPIDVAARLDRIAKLAYVAMAGQGTIAISTSTCARTDRPSAISNSNVGTGRGARTGSCDRDPHNSVSAIDSDTPIMTICYDYRLRSKRESSCLVIVRSDWCNSRFRGYAGVFRRPAYRQ